MKPRAIIHNPGLAAAYAAVMRAIIELEQAAEKIKAVDERAQRETPEVLAGAKKGRE